MILDESWYLDIAELDAWAQARLGAPGHPAARRIFPALIEITDEDKRTLSAAGLKWDREAS